MIYVSSTKSVTKQNDIKYNQDLSFSEGNNGALISDLDEVVPG